MKFHHLLRKIVISSVALSGILLINVNAHAAQNVNHQSVHVAAQRNTQSSVRSQFNVTPKQTTFHPVSHVYQYQAFHATARRNRFNQVKRIAKSKLGDRYVWGGNGPHVFDCSGFTKYVYQKGAHKNLPRTAEGQRNYCKHVARGHEHAGDLAFFGHGSAGHVGLCLGHGKMIDAQNRGVVIENIHAPWWHLLGYGRI